MIILIITSVILLLPAHIHADDHKKTDITLVYLIGGNIAAKPHYSNPAIKDQGNAGILQLELNAFIRSNFGAFISGGIMTDCTDIELPYYGGPEYNYAGVNEFSHDAIWAKAGLMYRYRYRKLSIIPSIGFGFYGYTDNHVDITTASYPATDITFEFIRSTPRYVPTLSPACRIVFNASKVFALVVDLNYMIYLKHRDPMIIQPIDTRTDTPITDPIKAKLRTPLILSAGFSFTVSL